MPQVRINIKTETKGPIFDAAYTRAAAKRMVIAINEEIAREGVVRVRGHLKKVLKHPTGYYQSRIAILRRVVYRGFWDSGVVYGGWLEGVDSRNRTMRFKGYRTFRIVKAGLDRDSVKLAQRHVDRFVNEMNGRA